LPARVKKKEVPFPSSESSYVEARRLAARERNNKERESFILDLVQEQRGRRQEGAE
jgi:hypothetical protein